MTSPPYDAELPRVGLAAILAPLIIGGAVIIGALILWRQHEDKAREFRTAKVEEEVRAEILSAYRLLRDERCAEALALLDVIGDKLAFLCADNDDPGAYSDFHAAILMLAAEAEYTRDPGGSAVRVEDGFTRAMGFIRHASGEMWEFALMGRARARFTLERFAEAVGDLDLLLAGNPGYGAAYYWRSLAKEGLGDAEGAASDRLTADNLGSWPPIRDPVRRSGAAALDIFSEN